MFWGILALVALGTVVYLTVKITFDWIRNKIREKLNKKNAKKVMVSKIGRMVEECENEMSLEQLNELEKYDMVAATVTNSGEVEDVEFIQNTDSVLDDEVERLLKGKGQVVVTN